MAHMNQFMTAAEWLEFFKEFNPDSVVEFWVEPEKLIEDTEKAKENITDTVLTDTIKQYAQESGISPLYAEATATVKADLLEHKLEIAGTFGNKVLVKINPSQVTYDIDLDIKVE